MARRVLTAHALFLVFLLPLGGCSSDFQGRVQATSERLDRWAESHGLVPQNRDALYQDGLALQRRRAHAEAADRFRQAAEAGHAAAAYELAEAYRQGRGVEKDSEQAATWYNLAAERGVAEAQFLIGAAYYAGTGVEQNYEAAAAYLGEAAVQGHPQAQYLLAEAFANGQGVPRNLPWAARWYGKAAAQGFDQAQFAYGVVQATGLGLPTYRVAGYGWLLLAAHQGHAKAEAVRQALAKKMTPDQIRKAEAWANHFKPQRNPLFADPPTVMYVQRTLNDRGFNAGPVDGVFGPRTRAAIERFQRTAKLSPDGVASPELLLHLLAEQNKAS
jgi:localization factor PodJL